MYCETLEKAADVIRDHPEVDYLIVRSVWPPLPAALHRYSC